jgi:pimeloyl-ACP methyl ester carboxylesterase
MNNKIIVCIFFTLTFISSVTAATLDKFMVQSNGHAMAVWHKQNSDSNTKSSKGSILLLHGRTWSALPDFDLQVEGEALSVMDNLAKQGFDVWALDARGYGETKRDATGWNTPNKAADDVANVLKWITKKSGDLPMLFGWSYGSMTAQLAVQKYPELSRAVILYGYPVDPYAALPEFTFPDTPPMKKNTAQNAASDFIVKDSISQLAIDTYVSASLAADPIRADWNELAQWAQLDAKKITIPVMFLQGEHDPLALDSVHARMFVEFPNANKQWVVLAGGDHAALLETPKDRLVQSVADFVVWLGK